MYLSISLIISRFPLISFMWAVKNNTRNYVSSQKENMKNNVDILYTHITILHTREHNFGPRIPVVANRICFVFIVVGCPLLLCFVYYVLFECVVTLCNMCYLSVVPYCCTTASG
jgi:hypothetical protein